MCATHLEPIAGSKFTFPYFVVNLMSLKHILVFSLKLFSTPFTFLLDVDVHLKNILLTKSVNQDIILIKYFLIGPFIFD